MNILQRRSLFTKEGRLEEKPCPLVLSPAKNMPSVVLSKQIHRPELDNFKSYKEHQVIEPFKKHEVIESFKNRKEEVVEITYSLTSYICCPFVPLLSSPSSWWNQWRIYQFPADECSLLCCRIHQYNARFMHIKLPATI